jgi:hypothetical protein
LRSLADRFGLSGKDGVARRLSMIGTGVNGCDWRGDEIVAAGATTF